MKHSNVKTEAKIYGQFSGKAKKELIFDLTKSIYQSVPAALYEYVKWRAEQNLRCLPANDYFSLEDLVGAACWTDFDEKEKRLAALCIGHLYQTGVLAIDSSGFGLIPPDCYYFSISDEAK